MLAILYLILCVGFGFTLTRFCIPNTARLFTACSPSKNVVDKLPPFLFTLPTGIVVGFLCVPMFNYYVTFLLNLAISNHDLVRRVSILVTFAIFIVAAGLLFNYQYKKQRQMLSMETDEEASKLPSYKHNWFNTFYYGISVILITIAASYLIISTYHITDGILYAGGTVWSDLSPHTAMTSSFATGFNFPTQYMHYSGDGIQYHFFFYFLAGTLEYLGLPIDMAINIPSIIGIICALILAGDLAVLLFRKRAAFVLTPVFILFRSALNVFVHIKELCKSGLPIETALENIIKFNDWYDITPYDNWGIWAINVYPNQRHLMLGVSVMLILVILFTPYVRRMSISLIKAWETPELSRKEIKKGVTYPNRFIRITKTFFATKEGWLFRTNDPLNPLGTMILGSILVICLPFFHGSALIGALLVLAFMAIFSETRLSYAVVAATAVLSSMIQTRIFSGGANNVVHFMYVPGFVVEDKTISGIFNYLFNITGFTLIISIVFVLYLLITNIVNSKPLYREVMYLAFLIPLIFAFNVQVSLEMLANHKFIQFTLILVDVFVAGAISEMFSPGNKPKEKLPKSWYITLRVCLILVGSFLIIPLTATGISEWCVYKNKNDYLFTVDTNSKLVSWIEENTDTSDVFLTPTWSLNRFVFAGRPMYYGWPYYAWSAGHDTYTREDIYHWLLRGCDGDIEAFRSYCESRGIRYLIDDPEFWSANYSDGDYYNIEFFYENLTQVAYFPEENTTIFKIY
ncbi:MAG: hypothetical protein MJ094_00620 [Saccharofermentans sp.]|nr:hypothetical protein [Saccharofermentans sp.]